MATEVRERKSTGFLVKQRAFIKLYLLTMIEKGIPYGNQSLKELQDKFEPFGYKPQHPEIYKALHELYEDGYVERFPVAENDSPYKKVIVYKIVDKENTKAYRKLLKHDLDRSQQIIRKAIEDNFS